MSFFNADFAASRRRRQDQYQQAIQNILAKRMAAENQFIGKTGMLGVNKKKDLRSILNNFASRGMAFSTGYLNKNQDVEGDYARQQSEAESQKNAALTEAQQQEAEENSRFQYDLSDIASQQAQYEAEQQRQLVAALAEQAAAAQQIAPAPAAPAANVVPRGYTTPTATLGQVMGKKKNGRYFQEEKCLTRLELSFFQQS